MNDPETAASILLIDQDRSVFDPLAQTFAKSGVNLCYAASIRRGLKSNGSSTFDVILLRDELNGGLNREAIAAFLSGAEAPEVIVFTMHGDLEQAKKALKIGVWEYVIDVSPARALPDVVQRALRYRKNKVVTSADRQKQVYRRLEQTGIIGRSEVMQKSIDQVIRIAQSEANVLIFGESGTGKELFASAIHDLSSRSKNGLTIIDCAALAPSLAESILFGHVKGSFTGADKAQLGLVAQSDGGTLFLDEIGELPMSVQKKLLRVIQERTYLPVGSTTERKSDFRLISATNKDLQSMVAESLFREDLLFRLKTFFLELPPLRARVADIAELAYFCRNQYCRLHKLQKKKFSPDYLMVLAQYDWPGNVRELFQAVERSITDALESDTLYPVHLPPGIRIHEARRKLRKRRGLDQETAPDTITNQGEGWQKRGSTTLEPMDVAPQVPQMTLKEARDAAIARQEKEYLTKLLSQTGGDIKTCCSIAGLSRSRLYDLLKKYELLSNKPPRSTSSDTQ